MRKELIIILLGIIVVSFLSSLLSAIMNLETDKLLLDTVVGVVGAGNFSYWQLGHSGPLLVELTSISGDADLYVSDSVRPSYEVDRNNFSSITCGPDVVSVPADFPRPLGIGIFGHWSHTFSEYSIQVFLDAAAGDVTSVSSMKSEPELKRRERPPAREEDNKPRFMMRLLNILDMIFEVFVL